MPKTYLDFIHSFGLTKAAKIIDIGDGDSKLKIFCSAVLNDDKQIDKASYGQGSVFLTGFIFIGHT